MFNNGEKSNNSASFLKASTAKPNGSIDSDFLDKCDDELRRLKEAIEKVNSASPNPSNEAGAESLSKLQAGMEALKKDQIPSIRPIVVPQPAILPPNRAGFMTHATSAPAAGSSQEVPSEKVHAAKVYRPG